MKTPANLPTGSYLVPSNDKPHELRPNYYKGPLPYNQAALWAEISHKLDPKFFQQTPSERAAAVEAAISSKFTYNVDPISPNEMYGVHSLDGYEERMLASKVANCNEANSTEALIDPNLTTVTGYFDDGSPNQMKGLYSHSLHMYDVDGHGNIYDATPVRMPRSQAAYFSTKPQQQPQPASQLPWELGGAALLLGGIGLWQRRRVAQGVDTIRATYGDRLQRQLAAQGDIALLNTVELAQRSLYAPSLDPASALARVKERQRAAEQAAAEQQPDEPEDAVATLRLTTADDTAARLVARPDLHSRSVARSLRRAHDQTTDAGAKTALKATNQAIRKSRWARRISPRNKPRKR